MIKITDRHRQTDRWTLFGKRPISPLADVARSGPEVGVAIAA